MHTHSNIMPVLHIAVFTPLRRCFDYKPLTNQPCKVGMRVKISFANRTLIGVILKIDETSDFPLNKLKTITACLDPEPLLKAMDIKLLNWVIQYYHCNPGDALAIAFPINLRSAKKSALLGTKGWCLTPLAKTLDLTHIQQKTPKQAQILTALKKNPLSHQIVKTNLKASSAQLKILRDKAWIEACTIEDIIAKETKKEQAPQLNQEQQIVVDAIAKNFNQFKTYLINGITGSGKTEVYLTLIEIALKQQKQILVLVPEISLTPQLLTRFERRLNARIAIIHSALNNTEKEQAWLQCQAHKADVLIGTRSAVFTPLPKLGLIIIDEEHDGSFKEHHGVLYSARDVVIVRAKNQQVPVVLGTATPSLESFYNASTQRYQQLWLKKRAGNAIPPKIELLNILDVHLEAGMSLALLKLIEKTLQQNNQVLIFLNRRGFAPILICHHCGWVAGCDHCDSRLTLHAKHQQLRCHHCGYQQPLPVSCPQCQSAAITTIGQGTERLENVLSKKFPNYPLTRIDRDTTSRKGHLAEKLAEVKKGEKKIIIGTQMLAKGHHFPEVTLVVLLDIDQGLFGVDYRSTEIMAQLITQVSGRAGRAEKKGRVVIQTRHPDHPLLLDLIQNGYASCAEKMLNERQEAQLPPYSYQALVRVDAKTSALAHQLLEEVAKKVQNISQIVEALGPVEAPMHKKAGIYRAHLLLQCQERKDLHYLLHYLIYWLEQYPLAKKLRWSLDIDPKNFA